MVDKLYLVTREDLPPGQQAVQAAHALRQFVSDHPETDQAWFQESNTLAILTVRDQQTLGKLLKKALDRSIPVARFLEPDRGSELTAIALGPQGKKLTRGLPLALQGSSPLKT